MGQKHGTKLRGGFKSGDLSMCRGGELNKTRTCAAMNAPAPLREPFVCFFGSADDCYRGHGRDPDSASSQLTENERDSSTQRRIHSRV